MKLTISAILLLILFIDPITAVAQEGWNDTIYYNKQLYPGANVENAVYFRPPVEKLDEEHYRMSYHRMNGTLHLVFEGLPGKTENGYSLEINKAVWDGHVIFYDSLGKKKSEGPFIKGEKLGLWTVYRPGGVNIEYTNEIGSDNDLYLRSYRESPNVVTNAGHWERYKENGKETIRFKGKRVFFYQNGDTFKVYHYNDIGKLQGHFVVYDSATRNIKIEGYYANDNEEGQWTYYNPLNSKPLRIKNYKGGKLHGAYAVFDSASGTLIIEGNIIDTMMTGKWTNYDAQTGKLIKIRNYKQDKLHGQLLKYDVDGNIRESENYKNGKLTGTCKYYYDGTSKIALEIVIKGNKGKVTGYDSLIGKKLFEGNMLDDGRIGKLTRYYEGTEKVWYTQYFSHNVLDGEMLEYAEDGHLLASSQFEKGDKVTMVLNHENTEKKWMELHYVKDTLVSMATYYLSGKKKREQYVDEAKGLVQKCYNEYGEEIPFTPIRTNPQFPGDVMTYIGDNLKYPEDAKDMRVEGKVVVSFVVNEDGSLSDVYVQKGFDQRCDEEAVRLVSSMPLWKPAEIDGIPFRMYQTLPIVFWLPEETSDLE